MRVLFVSNPYPPRIIGGSSGRSGVRGAVFARRERCYAPRDKSADLQVVNNRVDQSDMLFSRWRPMLGCPNSGD
jgi:hypothetical protein